MDLILRTQGEIGVMEPRKLKQYGWTSGPVECRCTACDWSASFIASDSSTPAHVLRAFAEHRCSYVLPEPVTSGRVALSNR
jgi:hypothetical protein